MVVERRNFQRVYDLTHRVMPHWDDTRDLLSQDAAEAIMLGNSARSLGMPYEQDLARTWLQRFSAPPPGKATGLAAEARGAFALFANSLLP